MSATFDPYYKWLGIAPKDQPPNHYRLLGLENFEPDLQVIEAAADRQLGFLRKFQSGERGADCQKLLNEVSRARLCLLKPTPKAEYDAELRKLLEGGNEFPDIEFTEESPDEAVSVKKAGKKRGSKTGQLVIGGISIPIPAAIGGGLAVVLIAGLIVFNRGPRKPPVPAVLPDKKPVEVAKATPEQTAPLTKIADQPAPDEPEPPPIPPDGSDEIKSKFFGDSRRKKKTSRAPALSGPVVDVLPLLKDSKYVIGNWKIDPARLEAAGAMAGQRIALPVPVPREYTVHLRGVRSETPGAAETTIGLLLVCGEHRALFAMDVLAKEGSSGLQLLDGLGWNRNETTVPGFQTQVGKPFDLDAIVRRDGIEVRVDGRTIVDWKGEFWRLSLAADWEWNKSPPGQLLVVSAGNCVFSELTVGPPLAPQELPGSELKTGESVELLPLVEMPRDAWDGKPIRVGNSVQTDTNFYCKFRVPFNVPPEYSLQVDFETELPALEFCIGFPFQSGQGIATFGNNQGNSNYLCIDRAWSPSLPDRFLRQRMIHEKRTTLQFLVRNNHVQISNGKETIFDWRGDSRRFLSEWGWATPGNCISFGTHKAVYKFHSVKLTRLPESKSPFTAPATPKNGDLLAIVDPPRDTTMGLWTNVDGMLASSSGVWNAIRFPAPLPGNYDFRIVLERKVGDDLLEISLPIDRTSAMVAIDGLKGTTGGIELIDGKSFDQNSASFKYTGHKLPIGKKSVIWGRVQGRQLIVDINGERLIDRPLPDQGIIDHPSPRRAGFLTPEERQQMALSTDSTFEVSEVRFRTHNSNSPQFPDLGFAVPTAPATPPATKSPAETRPVAGRAGLAAIPELTLRQAASVKIREKFAAEFGQLTGDKEKLALAVKLEQYSAEPQDDPATKYVSLEMAREFAVEAGDVGKTYSLADKMISDFAVDVVELKTIVTKMLAAQVKGPVASKDFLDNALPVIESAIALERFAVAAELAAAAIPVATKVKDKAYRAEAGELKKNAEALSKEFVIADAARKTLEMNSADPDANLKWGRWLCLRKRNWDEGLPKLAASSDSKLKGLAKRELGAPTSMSAMIDLGNDWLSLAKSAKDHGEVEFASRALFWLQSALTLASGSEVARIEQLRDKALDVRDRSSPTVNYASALEQVEKKVQQSLYTRLAQTGQKVDQAFETISDPPGILVGMNCAIGEFGGIRVVKALQPVYITRVGQRPGPWQGSSTDRIERIVEVRARPGYAINGFISQCPGCLDNTQISFATVTRRGLDPQRTYRSAVIGLELKKDVEPFGMFTGTDPVIGLFGYKNDWVLGFGMIATK